MPSAFFHTRRLQTRILAVYLGLLLVVQGTTYWVIHNAIDRNARQSVAESLGSGEALLLRLLHQQQDALQQATRALAEDASLHTALTLAQPEGMLTALRSHREAVRASVTLLTTPAFVPLSQTEDSPGTALAMAALLPDLLRPQVPAHTPAAQPRQATPLRVVRMGGQIYQLAAMAVPAPAPAAWVLMATRIDTRLLQELHSLSGLDLALLTPPESGNRWQVLDATLPADSWPRLAQAWENGPRRGTLSQPTFHVADDEFSARALVLPDLQGHDVLRAVLMRSVDQAIAPYRELKLTLLGLSALGVLAFGLVGMFSARRITAPLRELSSSARQLGRGEYDSEVSSDFDGEIGELAQSFETMRQTIQAREGELRRLVWQDPLTELPNLEQFRRDLRQAVGRASQHGVPCAVLLLDMDRFKQVNDQLGHRFGDRLLRAVAQRLHDGLHDGAHGGHTPVLARLSGDEFGILLPGADAAAAWPVAQRILADFERPLVLDGHTVDLGAGIGIAASPAHGLDADTVLSRAELAMNTAKQQQAGTVSYHAGLDATASASLTLLGELRTAVDDSQLRLFLQPKVTLATGQVVGAEALVRWQHPERGVLSPIGFVPFAEQTGFVRLLTRWMIDEVARTAQALSQQGLAMKLAVNLSTRDLLDPELPPRLADAIARHQLAPDSLVLEITESAIMDDPERALHTLRRLRTMGVRLSIDDFGTGYSSLSYLKSLPVQELKMDRSFVMSMAADEHDAKIVQSTIELAHSLGLSVVAEGVENLATWELLQVLGCDEAQGHLIAKPMPARQFAAWVAAWQPPQLPQSAHPASLAASSA
ncbi:bifunctional diguanylate cyclase/phosphodiesterase [Aquabacterium sp.]|uniref:putative bifunctional diguanylate cyclase/phosphodiesterase n=1 Tax=Aquabacterium sp. TaxID=1872578 RepID=UPI002488ADBE|nr:bifunctional diguanylate cyclase/phosphodiesterase [Aquabacterium sp.]MDI1350315.1 EAL domain-containing protein [Aquabacterium sp.]